MKFPSRCMPDLDRQPNGWQVNAVAIIVSSTFWATPGLIWWPLAFVLPAVVLTRMLFDWRRDLSIAKLREKETIGNFARSFNWREIDTWIIRAVYEEFSYSYPIRSADNFEADLRVDQGHLEDSIENIAMRIGRSLDRVEDNQYYGRINTVHDLVMFFQEQPLTRNQSQDRQ